MGWLWSSSRHTHCVQAPSLSGHHLGSALLTDEAAEGQAWAGRWASQLLSSPTGSLDEYLLLVENGATIASSGGCV